MTTTTNETKSYMSGKSKRWMEGYHNADYDITKTSVPLDRLRLAWKNCQCNDEYDQGYHFRLKEAERKERDKQLNE